MNGLTQGKIAIICSSLILFLGWGAMLFIYYLLGPFAKLLFLIPLVSSILLYLTVMVLTEYFILRKVRILYRTVSSIGKIKAKQSLQDPELFEKLRLQVQQYADQKSIEIDRLKENEIFRKEFMGNVSHELKTPLFSIQGFTEILLTEDLAEENRQKYLQKIARNTERLTTIVEELLTITRAENNQLYLKKEKFLVYELTLEAIQNLEEQAKKKKIKIEIKDSSHIHYSVHADRFRISQVLLNLIENAIFYNPDKTKIDIRFFDLEKKVMIEIEDDGKGIADQHLPRIFERFYRVDEDRSRYSGGSGLGLSIVKNILEAHGQTITAESVLGRGTIFRFTLDK
jgi:two-component system, OmpR family, phosphate regulon sensor histidine kinase PhoR